VFVGHGPVSKSSYTATPLANFAVVDADEAGAGAGRTVAILVNVAGQCNDAVAFTYRTRLLLRLMAGAATGRATNRKEICFRNVTSPDELQVRGTYRPLPLKTLALDG